MNKIFSFCTFLMLSVLTLMLGSCTEDYEYSAATPEGEQVYFKTTLASRYDLDLNKSTFQVEINRIQSKGELTVNLNASKDEGSIFTIPTSVTFADGATSAEINISYDPQVLLAKGYGYYEDITLNVSDAEYTTPYGVSSCAFSAGLTEWVSISEEDGNKAWFRDGLMSSTFGTEVLTYQLELQKSNVKEGRYRLVNPYYGETNPFYMSYGSSFSLNSDAGIVFDISDPDYVYIEGEINVGQYQSQDLVYTSMVEYYLGFGNSLDAIKANVPECFGKLKDGVITFSDETMIMYMGGVGPYYANENGMLAIAMPGYEISDYSSSFTYSGRFTDSSNTDYMQGTITLGEDVASARWVIASDGDDVNEIISGVNNGSIESNYITTGEDIQVELSESGDYTVIIITYDAEGNMKGNSATTFTFRSSKDGSGSEETQWEAFMTGTFKFNHEPAFIGDENGNPVGSWFGNETQTTTLYADPEDQTRYRIYPWAWSEDGLIFTLDPQTGIINFQDIDTGDSVDGYGPIYASDVYTLGMSNEPTSYYAYDGNLWFGTVYYAKSGEDYLWAAGSYELFIPDAPLSGVSANKMPALKKNVGNGMVRSIKKGGKVKLGKLKKVELNSKIRF